MSKSRTEPSANVTLTPDRIPRPPVTDAPLSTVKEPAVTLTLLAAAPLSIVTEPVALEMATLLSVEPSVAMTVQLMAQPERSASLARTVIVLAEELFLNAEAKSPNASVPMTASTPSATVTVEPGASLIQAAFTYRSDCFATRWSSLPTALSS